MSRRHTRLLRQIRPKQGQRPAPAPYSHDYLEILATGQRHRKTVAMFDLVRWYEGKTWTVDGVAYRLVKA